MFSCSSSTYNFSSTIFNNKAMIPYTTGLRIFSVVSTEHHMALWPIWYHCQQNIPAVFLCPDLSPVCVVNNIAVLHWTPKHCWLLLQKKVWFIIAAWQISLFVSLSGWAESSVIPGRRQFPGFMWSLCSCVALPPRGLPFGTSWFLLCWYNFSSSLWSSSSYSFPVLCQRLCHHHCWLP